MLSLPATPRTVSALQRVLLVALLAPVVLIAVIAAVPALVLLPFFPGGTDRVTRILAAYTSYVRTLLAMSRSKS